MRALEICYVCRPVKLLQVTVVTSFKNPINPISSQNPVSSHAISMLFYYFSIASLEIELVVHSRTKENTNMECSTHYLCGKFLLVFVKNMINKLLFIC
jgi:hypothetical protein